MIVHLTNVIENVSLLKRYLQLVYEQRLSMSILYGVQLSDASQDALKQSMAEVDSKLRAGEAALLRYNAKEIAEILTLLKLK